MLQIHAKYTELIKDIFQNDSEFLSALDKACSVAINHRPNSKTPCRSPELVKQPRSPSIIVLKDLIVIIILCFII